MKAIILIALLTAILKNKAQEQVQEPFSCNHRPAGYYADVETGCQIYHMCDGLGRQFSYVCPNGTLFQQRMMICDHWYMVNCNKSEVDYSANLLIGQRDKPFVEDSQKHPYNRTPRPDLLSQQAPDYNDILRTGRSSYISNLNLVGLGIDNADKSPTINTHYSLPTHWFTKLYDENTSTTQLPIRSNQKVMKERQKQNIKKKPILKEFVTLKKQRQSQDKVEEIGDEINSQSSKPVLNDDHWKNLKELFLIPDYDFPLDIAKRPGYHSGPSSFDISLTKN